VLVKLETCGSNLARADDRVSVTTLRAAAGVFDRLEHAALDTYDKIVGLNLGALVVDGCIVKGLAAGKYR
jgi:hypothetical protein